VVVRLVAVRGPAMLRAVMRALLALLGRLEILIHHHPAVFVPHDLLVGHAVALADRPL